jgi:hypothetical protein
MQVKLMKTKTNHFCEDIRNARRATEEPVRADMDGKNVVGYVLINLPNRIQIKNIKHLKKSKENWRRE